LKETRFSQLSKPRQILIRLCQHVNYGSILNVKVVNSDPTIDSSEVILDVRLEEQAVARQELELADFVLPAESCRLLAQIDSLTNGLLEKIVVHDGIPRRITLRRSAPLEAIV
jgi:hypothetical protein